MARAWIVDGRAIAKKVRNATRSSDHHIKDYGANRECPECHCRIDNSDVVLDWPGLPAGVKFAPSDAQLIEHLAAKCGIENSKPHAFIEEFIPTLHQEKGICYTHPERLPGAKKDGSSVHFFHKTANAYSTGQRKRRKVQIDGESDELVRWHKTGKTKPVMNNSGVHQGYKKIMVLYKSTKKGYKPDKANWVVHQFHLGNDEDEKEGEFVVSKVFYQQHKLDEKTDDDKILENYDALALQTSPRTPNPNPPNPLHRGKSIVSDDIVDDAVTMSLVPVFESEGKASHSHVPVVQHQDDVGCSSWLAGESQAMEDADFDLDDSLLCKENFDPSLFASTSNADIFGNSNEASGFCGASCDIDELEKLYFDIPPGFPDSQFGSQDSNLEWMNQLM